MFRPKDFQQQLRQQLLAHYDAQEAAAVAARFVEDFFQLSPTQVLLNETIALSGETATQLETAVAQLMANVPVQQVVGFEHFCGHRFRVTADTLIPRPETEGLVQLATARCCGACSTLLDVGTGTGCIAISLAKALPLAQVTAWDISEAALKVAHDNALLLAAKVDFQQRDLLATVANVAVAPTESLALWDAILSNPPYIPQREAATMDIHVTAHEPHTALFVPDDDPLLFYRALAQLGWQQLRTQGALLVETHTDFASAVASLFESMGYTHVAVHHDCFDQPRFVSATWEGAGSH